MQNINLHNDNPCWQCKKDLNYKLSSNFCSFLPQHARQPASQHARQPASQHARQPASQHARQPASQHARQPANMRALDAPGGGGRKTDVVESYTFWGVSEQGLSSSMALWFVYYPNELLRQRTYATMMPNIDLVHHSVHAYHLMNWTKQVNNLRTIY